MSKKAQRIAMYLVCIAIGVATTIAGAVQLSAAELFPRLLMAAGCSTVAVGIYAWVRCLGPLDMNDSLRLAAGPAGETAAVPPGFHIEWYDFLVIVALYAVPLVIAGLV